MLTAQAFYGPHDERLWSDGRLAIGRRLFRTLPEDSYDRQPLVGADGRFNLVADVRLDNREELAAALDLSAERMRNFCDAAVLLAGLERWGEGVLDRLAGDFAFALWNSSDHTLLLARDFLGQRPLHYHRGDGFFAFASMPKGLHAVPEIPYSPDEKTMAEFVTLMPADGVHTFFAGIETVGPGEVMIVTATGLHRRTYWQPTGPIRSVLSANDYAEGLRHHLDQATRSRLRGSGGTVASHLSAGFDSSAVTSTAARLLAVDGGTVVSFTAVPRKGFAGRDTEERIANEGPLAAATASLYPNIEHVLVAGGDGTPLDKLDRDFFLYDRPILNLCNSVWISAVNDAVRQRKLSVVLTGQMGNMTISYNGVERLSELVSAGRFVELGRVGAGVLARRTMSWRGLLASAFGPFMPGWLWERLNERRHGTLDVHQYTAIRADRLRELNLPQIAKDRQLDFSYRPRRDGFESRLWIMRRVDLGNYNKGTLGGWGIDQRDPTADKRLVEFCLSVPMEQYLREGEPRSLGRRALADRLPRLVLDERRKGYQAADWYERLSAARAQLEVEVDRLALCQPAAHTLDVARMKELVAQWPEAGWERRDVTNAYRLALLRGVSAGYFLRKVTGSNQ